MHASGCAAAPRSTGDLPNLLQLDVTENCVIRIESRYGRFLSVCVHVCEREREQTTVILHVISTVLAIPARIPVSILDSMDIRLSILIR